MFEAVAELEGHADNAAASVYGGVVVASEGRVRQLEVSPSIRLVVGVPDSTLATAEARAALPPAIGRDVVARNLARVVFLTEGLRTAEVEAFAGAAGDELHEPPRRELSPITGSLMSAALDAGALHAAWSGAGPSVLAFAAADTADAVEDAMVTGLAGKGRVIRPGIAQKGWR